MLRNVIFIAGKISRYIYFLYNKRQAREREVVVKNEYHYTKVIIQQLHSDFPVSFQLQKESLETRRRNRAHTYTERSVLVQTEYSSAAKLSFASIRSRFNLSPGLESRGAVCSFGQFHFNFIPRLVFQPSPNLEANGRGKEQISTLC